LDIIPVVGMRIRLGIRMVAFEELFIAFGSGREQEEMREI
jgi:hypothetical protein